MIIRRSLSVEGLDVSKLVRAIQGSPWLRELPVNPHSLSVGNNRVTPSPELIEQATAEGGEFHARWEFLDRTPSRTCFLSCDPDFGMVKLGDSAFELTCAEDLLAVVCEWPFEVGAMSPFYSWYRPEEGKRYRAPSFMGGHYGHGWACFFKGAGHERLVSRRWLDFGPWRVLRGANDTTMVVFHQLGVDEDIAREQAKPGHQRMSGDEEGGDLSYFFELGREFDAIYKPDRRQLRVICHEGRDVTQREMRDACLVRFHNTLDPEHLAEFMRRAVVYAESMQRLGIQQHLADRFGPDQPIESVAYVFISEADARKYLHELWLRELECWAFVDGKEIRLDLDYRPEPPSPPDWATSNRGASA
ncbi:MAG: hypothetical protein MJE77_42315 [Proteobacteria bacterium]|nr:hypothetical protein [Pseudomonadota bacterium]